MATAETLTILVADVVGSTELRIRLGEQRADELRREHDRIFEEAVARHAGRLVKGLGDGILATFDGAADAVASAVSIQQAIDQAARRLQLELTVRVGISSGDVTIDEGDCFGTPVIEASRLCAAADGGQILAAALVQLLARGRGDHRFSAVGDLDLKGLPDPVPAVSVEWERAASAALLPMPRGLVVPELDLAGRDTELAALLHHWKAARTGERRAVFLVGEPGIGKSRLAAEVARRAHHEGAAVLFGRSDESIGFAYQPFVEALGHLVATVPPGELPDLLGEHPGELIHLVPELASAVPGLPAPVRSDPDTERYRLFEAVVSWLGATAEAHGGCLLVVDDLHWAEKPTLLLLRHLVRAAATMPLLVIATYRDTDLDRTHPLSEMLVDFRRQPGVDRIQLSGLDTAGVAALLAAAASGAELDERSGELAVAIRNETEGNPFFIVEVLRSLVESGAIYEEQGRWTSDLEVSQIGIPEGVRQAVGARLARLSDRANEVLGVASVIGSAFEIDVLAAVLDVAEDSVLDALDEAVEANLLQEAAVGAYEFPHALVRATLNEELSATRRARRHRQIAQVLERQRPDDAAALAHHYACAGGVDGAEAALPHAVRAGDAALQRLAPDQAVVFYRQALELADELEGDRRRERAELLVKLGTAQRQTGDPEHRETFFRAAAVAREVHDVTLLAQAAVENNRGWASIIGSEDSERRAVLESAYRYASDLDDELRALLCATLASELLFSPDAADRRQAIAEEAIALGQRLGDPRIMARVFTASLPVLSEPDRHRELVTSFQDLAEAAEATGDPALKLRGYCWRMFPAVTVADVETLDRMDEMATTTAAEVGDPVSRWISAAYHGLAVLAHGDLAEGQRVAQEAQRLGEEAGQPDAALWCFAQQWLVALARDEASPFGDLFLTMADEHPDTPIFEGSGVYSHIQAGAVEMVAERFDRLARSPARRPPDYFTLVHWCYLGEIAAEIGHGSATEFYRLLRPHAGLVANFVIGALTPVDRVLGCLAASLGDVDAADHHFAAALAIDQRFGNGWWEARTKADWAGALARRGRPDDVERARDLVAAATEVASASGAHRVLRQISVVDELLA